MNLDYKDIIVLVAIIIIIIIFIYFFINFNKKTEEEVVIYEKPIHKIIPKFSNDHQPQQQSQPPPPPQKGYVNDVIPQKINNNINYEYTKQFPENISIPINPNSVGFCPEAKQEKSALPFANINVNVLLANSNSQQ